MEITDFSQSNSIINLYMSELRDKNYQKNRFLFRHNIKRIGELMAYELSKTLEYKSKTITTPLGTIDIPLPKDDMVIATVLRAGLPFHEGFLDVFDKADNGFVSAFRMYINREHTEVGIHTEYIATQSVKNKTLLIVDPMLATGGSLAAAIDSLLETGKPKKIHLCCVIAAPEGIESTLCWRRASPRRSISAASLPHRKVSRLSRRPCPKTATSGAQPSIRA